MILLTLTTLTNPVSPNDRTTYNEQNSTSAY